MNTPRVQFRRRAFDVPANIEAAKALLADGLSDREVAERLGVGRSSVAKMRQREGVPSRFPNAGVPAARSRDDRKAGVGVRRVQRVWEPKSDSKRLLRGAAWRALPGSQPVTLVDLEPGMCRWPIGQEAPYTFCGEPSGDRVYCEHHTKLSIGTGTESERTAHRAREVVRS